MTPTRIAVIAAILLAACERSPGPSPGSAEYDELVAAFHTGVAAIQVGEDERAERALLRVIELAPGEPAAAANLGIVAFQQGRLEDAARWVERAWSAAPDEPNILILAALVDRGRGRLDEAIRRLRLVADVDAATGVSGSDPRVRFLLVQLLEQRAGPGDRAESQRLLEQLLVPDATDAFLLVESARQAARQGERAALARALERLEPLAAAWPEAARLQLERVRAEAVDPASAGMELAVLAATLEPLPSYARQRDAVLITEQQPDIVLTEFVRLPAPSPQPPAPDLELRFVASVIDAPGAAWLDARPLWLGGEATARIALLGSRMLWLAGQAGDPPAGQTIPVLSSPAAPNAPPALAALDFDYDFRIDLAIAGDSGLRLLRQDAGGRFVEIERAAVPQPLRTQAYTGVWAADIDMDGDMDLVLATPAASPLVLLNQGNGTFAGEELFDDAITRVRQFVWVDLDDDGDPDAVFLDAGGRVHVFANPRRDEPQFVRRDVPDALSSIHALAHGDLDADGTFDLLALREDGALLRAWIAPEGWQTAEAARWPEFTPSPDAARLIVADLDNNSALDVVASAAGRTQLWLGDGSYALVAHESLVVAVTAAADLTGGGRVELLAIDASGQPVRLSSRPGRDYYALTMSPRAADQPGDRRINTFGIGGVAEVRAGMLYQKQSISAPVVHFGIGEHTGVNVARIIWPNGIAQAEFDLLATQGGEPILAPQRLKGSCPWLFAYDGGGIRFVTDIIWRTALGLRINTYGSSAVIHSEDWVKIRGDQLAPRDGLYELSITAELWESHFFDHLSLMVVDHPDGTEVFVDEWFMLPPPELKVHATGPLQPVAAAADERGRDVTALVAARDERYVDTFELGDFQGVARDHFLELDLGADAPADAPLLLVAHGWVYPTDGSINLAIGQGGHSAPRGIRVEVADGRGGWTVVHSDLGMPAGKTKTVLIDLAGAFREGTPRRVRLWTNMEIYWDHAAWAEARPDTRLQLIRLLPDQADLRYRGFSRTRQAGRKAPELPDYSVAGTAPRWRDLAGYHTRFGDVRPLLRESDDRYVIMNAGDELLLRFAASPEPSTGWVRDYVLISDGWAKDGDFNNGFSSTLLPLPYHGMADYSRPPGRLEDDPAFRRHPGDWREYHTRYVTPGRFHHVLSRD